MIENREQQIKSASEIIAYGCSDELKAALIQDFPELAESEDERIRKELIKELKSKLPFCSEEFTKHRIIRQINYLEKQKEQRPAEWSEEDEEHLDSIIESYRFLLQDYKACHDVDYIPYNSDTVCRNAVDDIAFLKSLRPQPHWKPSEEQIKVMQKAVMYFGDSWVSKDQKTLESLYAELKKLH